MRFTEQLSTLAAMSLANQERMADPLPAPHTAAWARSPEPVYITMPLRLNTLHQADQGLFGTVVGAFDRLNEGFAGLPTTSSADDQTVVTVYVSDTSAPLRLGVAEDYDLTVTSSGIAINASTAWGALHAFNTLDQLILDLDGQLMVEQAVEMHDEPKYQYRGLMIDVARNFHSIESLKKQVDAMSFSKLNTLHLHLTDSQSWPIEMESIPEMIKGAYSKTETYTKAEMKDLIKYANDRGVRIVPELDLPGHSRAGWQDADPKIVVCGDHDPWYEAAVEPNSGQLDILNPDTYTILDTVYQELSALFDEELFHVGFDELNVGCYKATKHLVDWIKSGHSWSDLAQYWVDRAMPIFKSVPGRRLIMWQDAVLSADIPAQHVDKDVIMHAWTGGMDAVRQLTAMGYDTIVAPADFLYLDCGFGSFLANDPRYGRDQDDPSPGTPTFNYGGSAGSWCGPYKTWQRIYSLDMNNGMSEEQQKHVLGGSAQLWSEQSDGTNSEEMVWPRTAALAELLWSGNLDSEGNYRGRELTQRILKFREFLVAKGIRARPLMPKYCLTHPYRCEVPDGY